MNIAGFAGVDRKRRAAGSDRYVSCFNSLFFSRLFGYRSVLFGLRMDANVMS